MFDYRSNFSTENTKFSKGSKYVCLGVEMTCFTSSGDAVTGPAIPREFALEIDDYRRYSKATPSLKLESSPGASDETVIVLT